MGNRRSRKPRSRVPEASGKKPSQEIQYDLFFAQCVQEGRLRAEQHREVLAFFRDLGLGNKEDPKVYEDALGKF